MKENRVIGIIGDASIELQAQYELAFLVGKKLIDDGYMIATGGLGGVMEAASKGALNSPNYDKKSVIAVLPNYDFSSANAYSDIVLPLGNGIERNGNLISICDAVIAIGGGAGTLSEISMAWQMGKLIICLGNCGWSEKLKNTKLDSRRDDYIYGAIDANEAMSILNEKIDLYAQTYKGICTNFSSDYAINLVKSKYAKEDVTLLGKGKSGIVVGNKNKVFKVFFDDSFELQAYLDSICKKFSFFGIKCEIENIEQKIVLKTNIYGKELKYADISFTEDDFINALNIYYFTGLVSTDIKPENFIVTENNSLILFDIDKDVIPYSTELFEIACREIFAIYKLQKYIKENSDKKFKKIIGSLQKEEDFSSIEQLLNESNLSFEYKHFKYKCGQYAIYKNLIYIYFDKNIKDKTVFDYGAGTLEIAANLQKKGYSVSAYDIDENCFKEKYSKGIDCFTNKDKLNEYINTKKFDTVLCSLVLCCVDDKVANEIVQNCKKLSKSRIVFVICNPLYYSSKSTIQTKKIDNYYSEYSIFTKQMNSTVNIRTEYHRPLGFYEKMFLNNNDFYIEHIIQSSDSSSNFLKINNSDFMLISLRIK